MPILPFALYWTWLILLCPLEMAADTNKPKKLNQVDIAKLLRNLERDSSKLGNGGVVLEHSKLEKNEIIEDDTAPGSESSGSSSRDQSEALGTTTAVESGETYLTGKPIKIKIKGTNESSFSSVFYSMKPEDDDWLKKKVEQIKKNLNQSVRMDPVAEVLNKR
ncbi:uncharacterized protein LOC116294685 [Actinia tenebrosa]|uniref:Uncharacterized protein LOC116294685 n=1 Tax=Actinia tenebrosa TaxID=6105 RepID=A0A6P8HP79_ACTTE|nr:uncharacterized protein LOC116294685 [Actinia tenebrosa]